MRESFPDAEHLAAFRAVAAGLSSREAVDLYLANRRPAGASARAVIGKIRSSLRSIADERHRPDLAKVFDATPGSRRSLEVPRAIEALRATSPPVPSATDDVSQWFGGRLIAPLHGAGVNSLADLVVRVAGVPLWWKKVSGLGRVGATQVAIFFEHYPALLARARAIAIVRPPSELAPWEHLKTPADLDGSKGAFRAPRSSCVMEANDDYRAVQTWLQLQESPATRRAYRKEVERLILWAIVDRAKALSSLSTEDAIFYRAFLKDPIPRKRWVGPIVPRSSPEWRPFHRPLKEQSAAYALQVINAMFRWLIEQRYVLANPFASVKLKAGSRDESSFLKRCFDEHEWGLVQSLAHSGQLENAWSEEALARLHFALDFSYGTGLRSSELVNARLAHLEIKPSSTWIQIRGKGQKKRRVVVPAIARSALDRYLHYRRLPTTPAGWIPTTPLIPQLDIDNKALSAGRLWEIFQGFFDFAATQADDINPALADKLRRASPHWMRHTHATHALNNGVATTAVRDNLGHASIATTSTYLHAEDELRARQIGAAFATRRK